MTVDSKYGVAQALRAHWPEYLMEAAALGTFMVSACVFGVLLGHPASPLRQTLPSLVERNIVAGIAMGLTAVGIICSPWGQRSGAHMNPAFTLTFLTLGKISGWDALFYAVFQFLGGLAGVLLPRWIIGPALAHPDVDYVVTVPGRGGAGTAFWAEFAISFLLVTILLEVSNSRRTAKLTPWVAGLLVATFIVIESPLSGMSMNPARTSGSALPAGVWTSAWVYFLAPARGHAAGRPGLSFSARRPPRVLRQAASRQSPALHLPLRLRSHVSGADSRSKAQ